MAVDLWTVERLYWMFSPAAKVIYASDPIIDVLRNEPQPVRVISFLSQRGTVTDPFITGDALMTYRIRNVLGYHGNQLARYAAAPRGPNNDLTGTNSGDNRLFSPNVMALTNTKYLLTNIPEFPFLPNVQLVKGPVRNAAGESPVPVGGLVNPDVANPDPRRAGRSSRTSSESTMVALAAAR